MLATFVLVGVLGVGLLIWRQRDRDTPGLQAVAQLLGSKVDGGQVVGTYQGLTVRFLNAHDKRGSVASVRVTVATGAVKLDVVRRDNSDERTRSAMAPLAVDLGDPAFSKEYLVAGAPAETVRAVLTPALRQQLLESRAWRVNLGDGAVTLHLGGLIEDEARARLLLDLAVGLARGLPK
jgi:hypothetical protein